MHARGIAKFANAQRSGGDLIEILMRMKTLAVDASHEDNSVSIRLNTTEALKLLGSLSLAIQDMLLAAEEVTHGPEGSTTRTRAH